MLAGNFFKSTAVRLATIYIGLFAAAYLVANTIAYQMVMGFLDDRLNANVMERYREISSAYEGGGINGAIEMIESHGPAIRGEETVYTLRDPSGSSIAGNAELVNVPLGLSVQPPDELRATTSHYKLFRGSLGDYDLTVGISYGDTDHLSGIVMKSFGWATAMIVVLGIPGAAFLAYTTRRRIFALCRTAHEIGHGELSKRLPVSTRMDDIDVLSTEVNVALARLEASVLAMKQVTTDVAHDLKTPIARTFLVLDDALQLTETEEIRAGIELALSELQSIADTFDALLRIAQIEAQNRTTNFINFDLKALTFELYEAYEAIAVESGYSLSIVNDESECFILGDPALIRQLLANLLTNAMRHTPAGTTISVKVQRETDTICLTVSDNGPGIPQGEHERVFERFYRLEKSRTTSGSGLGLSMVKAIAELHAARPCIVGIPPGLTVKIAFPSLEIDG
ncbi:MAG: ATPase [Alphaproteobacteria bacterium]|nr:ATPase [Alphaproteobacteria bacterium]